MVSVKDMNGNTHTKCPRCKSGWDQLDKNSYDYFICTGDQCNMMACLQGPDEYFLTLDIFDDSLKYQPFQIYWYNGGCLITQWFDSDDEDDIKTQLPLLPFDITLEKLKIYLVFS